MLKLIGFIVVLGVFAQAKVEPEAEPKLANYLLKSSKFIEENPQRSTFCFQTYLPKLNIVTEEYEARYDKCLEYADTVLWALEEEMRESRSNATRDASNSCEAYKKCNFKRDTLEFFDCYTQAANNATMVSKNIAKASTDNAEFMNIRLETTAYEKNRCTTEASRNYVDESTQIYADLDDCLAAY